MRAQKCNRVVSFSSLKVEFCTNSLVHLQEYGRDVFSLFFVRAFQPSSVARMHELNKSGPRRGWGGKFFLNKFFLLSFKVRAVKADFIIKKYMFFINIL